MAVSPCKEAKAYMREIVDENDSLHPCSSCFQIVKPDALPVVLENSSFPTATLKCPYQSSQGQDICNISLVSDEGITNPQCLTQLAFLSFLQVPQRTENPMCVVAHWNCKTSSTSEYSECSIDIDIKNKSLETSDDIIAGNSMKPEGAVTKALRWTISLQVGGNIMHVLLNHFIMLLKWASKDKVPTERTPDTPNNRLGRYKRSASFNSRKIAFLFSILSSIGTIVLIYLTLRVKQINDALVPAY